MNRASIEALAQEGTQTFTTSSFEETFELAKSLTTLTSDFSLFTLEGPLGAGKTSFAKGFIHALTGEPINDITSPTFTYLHIYEANIPILHFDLYRLQKESDLLALGFIDLFNMPCSISLIEWPQIAKKHLPYPRIAISIDHLDHDTRLFTLSLKEAP